MKAGDKAPDFSLVDDCGELIRLRDLGGKKVVLYFYPKDDTPGCTKEACSFSESLALLRKARAVVLGVSPDSIESHKKFRKKFTLEFPLLSDPDKKAARAYKVWKRKSMYGREFMGIERSTFVIDEKGRFLKIFRKVRVNGHTDEVLEALEDERLSAE